MHTIFYDLTMILPEILIIIGAMLTLLFGAYANRNTTQFPSVVVMLNVSFLLVSLWLLNQIPSASIEIFNGLYVRNSFSEFVKILILIAGIATNLMLIPAKNNHHTFHFEVPVLINLSIAGMLTLVSANNLLTLYVGLELMSLPLYILASSDRLSHYSTEAGMKYFVLGALSSGLYLFGASYIYGYTGTASFPGIYEYYSTTGDGDSAIIPVGFLIGLIFVIVAFCFKISAVPFHMWTPDVYQGSPTIITAFFASAPKIAGLSLMTWLLLDPFYQLSDQWSQIIYVVSVASMLVGSLGAIMQTNFKRLLAYSSIGHVGFALIGLVTVEFDGIRGVLLYLMIYLSMTIAAFACLIMLRKGEREFETLSDFSGLSTTHPRMAFAMAVLMLSMAGIPPLAGFFAKLYVLLPAIHKELYGLAIIAVVSSVIAAFYYIKVVKIMYFEEGEKESLMLSTLPLRAIVLISVVFNLFFIFAPSPFLQLAESAVEIFFG
jgi:NADH-quinone oxidoreductase subunit N